MSLLEPKHQHPRLNPVAKRLNGAVLREFRTLFHLGAIGDQTDGQLLERFSTGHRETAELAFAALVDRHGPMVLGVCRAILRDEHDAQDAFQATFLVLVRKARSLWVRDSIAPWLHQVAYRAARQARSARQTRLAREREATAMATTSTTLIPEPQQELSALLHEEIERLPARYRGPLVLCDLQGHTQEQAARQLGCPVGTIKSRLNRGRQRLKARLMRRGFAPVAGIGSMLTTQAVQAAVPVQLVQSTIIHSISFSASQGAAGVVPAAVASLTHGVLKAMMFTKVKMLTIPAFVLATALGAGVTGVGLGEPDPEGRQQGPPPVAKPEVEQDPAKNPTVPENEAGQARVILVERGTIEALESIRVVNQAEAPTEILSILPEGTRVEKDQLVCELDQADLREQLANQRIATQQAKVKSIEGQLKLAQAELELAQGRLEVVEKTEEKGQLLDLKIKQGKVDEARADLHARELALTLEKEKEDRLRRIIEKCKIYAPADGVVVYASPDIEEGAIVRPRQILFRVADLDGPMLVDTKVPKALIDHVIPGQKVLITVDAFPNQTLYGVVESIAPLPNPVTRFGLTDQELLYNSKVKIEGNPKDLDLRPGMTATVEVVTESKD